MFVCGSIGIERSVDSCAFFDFLFFKLKNDLYVFVRHSFVPDIMYPALRACIVMA